MVKTLKVVENGIEEICLWLFDTDLNIVDVIFQDSFITHVSFF